MENRGKGVQIRHTHKRFRFVMSKRGSYREKVEDESVSDSDSTDSRDAIIEEERKRALSFLAPLISEGRSLLRELQDLQDLMASNPGDDEVEACRKELRVVMERARADSAALASSLSAQYKATMHHARKELHVTCGRESVMAFSSTVKAIAAEEEALEKSGIAEIAHGLRTAMSPHH